MMVRSVAVSVIATMVLGWFSHSFEIAHGHSTSKTSNEYARLGRSMPIANSETILLQLKAQKPAVTDCCKQCGDKPFCSAASGRCYDWKETNYKFVSCGVASTEDVRAPAEHISNESVTPDASVDSRSPCLCVFDIDRTLTAAQGHVAQCPGAKEIHGVTDEAYGSGWLTLSALSAHGISKTFCNQCYIGVSSTGNAGGKNSRERAYLLEHVLVTDTQKEFNTEHVDATEWSYFGDVNSPLALHVPNTEKQFSVEDIRKWYSSKGILIAKEHVYFFGDRMENIPHFQEFGFNAREISCETRDYELYGGSGMVGFCGATPGEIVREQGIHSCNGGCCQKCGGKGHCSSISGNCYDSKKKSYYTTCGNQISVTPEVETDIA